MGIIEVDYGVDSAGDDQGIDKHVEPTSAPSFRHGIARKQTTEERNAHQEGEDQGRQMSVLPDRARRGDVNHLIEGRQQEPGRGLGRVGPAYDHRLGPDPLLYLGRERKFLLGASWIWFLVHTEPRFEVLTKETTHFGLVMGSKRVQAEICGLDSIRFLNDQLTSSVEAGRSTRKAKPQKETE